MKKNVQFTLLKLLMLVCALILNFCFISCNQNKVKAENSNNFESDNVSISKDLKDYWFSGKAEITSYELSQNRYGENHTGKAVLIYVTEDFDHEKLIKTDTKQNEDYPVLKLNSTKDFTTGIYPYHIMQSAFLPIEKNNRAVKITSSIQEWCGQSYMQLEQKNEQQTIQVNSYFQQIGNFSKNLDNFPTENALWLQLRLFPEQIDTTITSMIPSFEFLRLQNHDIKAYRVNINQSKTNQLLKTQLYYPELKRHLVISQQTTPPFQIEAWEEKITRNDSNFITTASKLSLLKIDYWNKNTNQFSFLRDTLKL